MDDDIQGYDLDGNTSLVGCSDGCVDDCRVMDADETNFYSDGEKNRMLDALTKVLGIQVLADIAAMDHGDTGTLND